MITYDFYDPEDVDRDHDGLLDALDEAIMKVGARPPDGRILCSDSGLALLWKIQREKRILSEVDPWRYMGLQIEIARHRTDGVFVVGSASGVVKVVPDPDYCSL